MRKGIHPMMHMVRVVLSNGASIYMPMAWQQPLSRGNHIPTRFLEVDSLNHEKFTGVPSRRARRLGRRAMFENKFVTTATSADHENSPKSSAPSAGSPGDKPDL
jgi:ribosomal protein L31